MADLKHDVLRDILKELGLAEKPEYFSEGSTVTTFALKAVRDEIQRRKGLLRGVLSNLQGLVQ